MMPRNFAEYAALWREQVDPKELAELQAMATKIRRAARRRWLLDHLLGILAAVAILLIAAVGPLAWYRIHFAMSLVTGFTVNDATSERRVLIATQGGAFKDAVVSGVVERLRQPSIFIQVVDVAV